MTFLTTSAEIVGILNSLGFTQSFDAVDFKDAPAQEYGKTFILDCESGEAGDANDQQAAQLYDNQIWTVKVAFSKNSQSDYEQLKELHIQRDSLLTALDDRYTTISTIPILRYLAWTVTKEPSYYILEIRLRVTEVLSY